MPVHDRQDIADRREDAINFIAAEMDAMHYAVTHRDETIELTRAAIHAKPDDPRPAYAYDETVKHGSIDPKASLAARQAELDGRRADESRKSESAIDLAKITAPTFCAEAAKRAGK